MMWPFQVKIPKSAEPIAKIMLLELNEAVRLLNRAYTIISQSQSTKTQGSHEQVWLADKVTYSKNLSAKLGIDG